MDPRRGAPPLFCCPLPAYPGAASRYRGTVDSTSMSSEQPRAHAHVEGVGAQFTAADGRTESLTGADADHLRELIVGRLRAVAAATGRTQSLRTSGDRGEHYLVVEPSGEVSVDGDDHTMTRAEVRQQAWWTHDREPVAEPDLEVEPEAAPEPAPDVAPEPGEAAPDAAAEPEVGADPADEPAGEPADEPAAAELPVADEIGRPYGDPEDDDDPFDETVPSSYQPLASAPRFFYPSDPVLDPAPVATATAVDPAGPTPAVIHPEDAVTAGAPSVPGAPRNATTRPSFIDPAPEHPALITGWRAVLHRLGVPVGPSPAERERAEREKEVSRQWAGCRTIAVANGKGGVGKTMSTAVLSAVFARHGGGNVLAWDNNDTRGTLGWRTEQGDYDTTIRDLLPEAERLLEATASVSDIARYVHHQSIDRYDVLRSNPELLAADQRITTADFDLLMQVAARYYRMVIFDSGNDESADRWLRMIDSAHQLVVPTLSAPESAESAALLLDALRRRDAHSRRLADEAVVIVSQSEKSSAAAVQEIADGFEGHVRAVAVIPFDDALKAGRIRYDSLQPRTRDAWLRAAAAVAAGL